jgi:hypothetical protein
MNVLSCFVHVLIFSITSEEIRLFSIWYSCNAGNVICPLMVKEFRLTNVNVGQNNPCKIYVVINYEAV